MHLCYNLNGNCDVVELRVIGCVGRIALHIIHLERCDVAEYWDGPGAAQSAVTCEREER